MSGGMVCAAVAAAMAITIATAPPARADINDMTTVAERLCDLLDSSPTTATLDRAAVAAVDRGMTTGEVAWMMVLGVEGWCPQHADLLRSWVGDSRSGRWS